MRRPVLPFLVHRQEETRLFYTQKANGIMGIRSGIPITIFALIASTLEAMASILIAPGLIKTNQVCLDLPGSRKKGSQLCYSS